MSLTKRGGLWFWRIGPIGGSVYVSRRPALSWHAANERFTNCGLIFVALVALAAL